MTDQEHVSRSQIRLALLVAGLALAGIVYRLLHLGDLDQTAALFYGLPAVLAVVVALTPRAGSAIGMAVKATVILLLLSGPILREGFVCILFASPLFLFVAVLIGGVIENVRRRRSRTLAFAVVPLVLVVPSLEGVTGMTTFSRAQTVTATRVVDAAPSAVERSLGRPPRIGTPLPRLLRLGFPRPVAASGTGLAVGDERVVVFDTAHGRRETVWRVAERRPGFVRFALVVDRTPVANWLGWRDATVRWHSAASGRTRVTWTIRFSRQLDPAWYFVPWERYGVRVAARYLIGACATR